MLERLRLTDFKSFVDEQAELSPLTLLVGANASGKSNFVDALRFLRQTALDMSLAEILDGEESGPGAWTGIRGGAREAARVGTSAFVVESTWQDPLHQGFKLIGAGWPADTSKLVQVEHRIACQTIPEAKLDSESLRAGSPGSPTVLHEVVPVAGPLAVVLGRLHFPDIQPRRMRALGKRHMPLGDDGSNISGVLARLCDDPEAKRTLVEWMAEICAPELADLDFIEVPELGDVMAVLVEKGGRRITARSLSDGTLRFLGMLVALRTAKPGSVILIEEIEADLHPTRIRLLVEYLQAVTRERDVQVIATTHSPVVLQWLDAETLGRAIVFGRVPEREGTLMRRLGDLPDFGEVVKRKGIDQLLTTGWLEMAL
jgi:AAA domain, putative AbiEii toxin, Type IV TA system